MKVWEKGSLRQDLHPFEDEDIGKLSGGPGLSHVNPPPDPEVSATVSATPITSSGVPTAPSGIAITASRPRSPSMSFVAFTAVREERHAVLQVDRDLHRASW